MKRALITGITGQDGSYLAELLLSKDYVEAMWLMLQQPQADDYVIATGETRSVRDFLDIAFTSVGLAWEKYVVVDPTLYRPTDVDCLLGDATKARQTLGWTPKTPFTALVHSMVQEDLRREGIMERVSEHRASDRAPCVLARAVA